MALEDSRDKRPHAEDLGQSFEAHSGNVGSAFEERNASPELVVEKKSHTAGVGDRDCGRAAGGIRGVLLHQAEDGWGGRRREGPRTEWAGGDHRGQDRGRQHQCVCERAGHGNAGRDGDAVQPDYGRGDCGALSRGSDCAQGRSAGGHRSATVPGDVDAGGRNPGARPGRAGAGRDGPAALPGSVRAQRHRETAVGRPGEGRAAVPGNGEGRPGNGGV